MIPPIASLLERWIGGGPEDRMTVCIKREYVNGNAIHILERKGGKPPSNWVVRIDPVTFEPMFVPPDNHQRTAAILTGRSSPTEQHNVKVTAPVHMIASETGPSHQNWFQRERYTTRAYIRDLRKIPRFVIDTPTFRFDSHADNPGWMLSCKQRHFNGNPGKLVIKLVHENHRVRSTVTIRPSNHNLHRVVETEDDFVEVFQDDFMVETDVTARQVHRPMSAYTDEELLAELKRRSDARLDGWRPRRKVTDLSNVIDLEQIRQNLPVLDEERLARILAA